MLEQLLLRLLEKEFFKTTGQLVEELRMEYPEQFEEVLHQYQQQHDFSRCSTYMSPLMAVGGALDRLFQEGRIERTLTEGQNAWKSKSQ